MTAAARGSAAAGEGIALITGGAGFVGCNVAASLLEAGWRVRILDDLSRPGVESELAVPRLRRASDSLRTSPVPRASTRRSTVWTASITSPPRLP